MVVLAWLVMQYTPSFCLVLLRVMRLFSLIFLRAASQGLEFLDDDVKPTTDEVVRPKAL